MAHFVHAGMTRRSFAKLGAAAAATAAVAGLVGCSAEEAEQKLNKANGIKNEEREVVDDAGRTVMIPAVIDLEKVFCTSALAVPCPP